MFLVSSYRLFVCLFFYFRRITAAAADVFRCLCEVDAQLVNFLDKFLKNCFCFYVRVCQLVFNQI